MFGLIPILFCSLQRRYSGILQEIILSTMILNISNRKVVYSKLSGAFTSADHDWQLGNNFGCAYNVIACDTSNIVFMDNYSKIDNSLMSKTFQLDPHYQVSFSFKFWRIDVWSSKLFEVYADQQIKYSRSFSDSDTPTNICQDATKSDESIDITITLLHNDPSLWVVLKGQGQRWGISNFELAIDECDPGCDSCSSSECFNQKSVPITLPWTTLETFPTKLGCYAYKFEWTYGTYMEMEIDLDTHIRISAKIRFMLLNYNTPTLDIKLDDQLVTSSQQISPRIIWTRSFCNHIQILQVAINDFVHTNPKIKIRADIILAQFDAVEGQPILGISDFQLFVTVSEKYVDTDSQGVPYEGCQLDISQFTEACAFCVRSVCLHCQEGWNYIELEQRCSPICGDAKIVQNEQCDDGNQIPYDGCYQCQYSCPLFCKNCVKGKCIECQQPQLLVNGQCLIQCNQIDKYSIQQNTGCFNQIDNFQVNGYYQHTIFDQDNLKFFLNQFLDCNPQHYGIFGFNYNQCRVNHIQLCENQSWDICNQCKDGFQLTKSQQQCVPVCNDGQIVDFEVCDDANVIPFDGCYKCQQSCQLECSNCVNSQCLRCIEGWNLIEGQCLPNCGDGITVQTEQCDDGNQEAGDGCYQCQAECPYCQICNYYNKCQLCQEHFRSVNMLCLPYCGDNYIEPGLEECDDGNEIQYDGCHNCQLECDTRCKNAYLANVKTFADLMNWKLMENVSNLFLKIKLLIILMSVLMGVQNVYKENVSIAN